MILTTYAKKEILTICISSILMICVSMCLGRYLNPLIGYSIAFITFIISFGLLAFFRDPVRKIPVGSNLLVSPADGIVKDIEILEDADENYFFIGKPIVRVGIFLSVFDVHINRAPCNLRVKKRIYQKGKYHDARNPLASKENEAMTLFCHATVESRKFTIIVKQISGAIARRIVCNADRGSKLKKGSKFGMIKFGSRTELFLPKEEFIQMKIKVGCRVYAGETILAEIRNS